MEQLGFSWNSFTDSIARQLFTRAPRDHRGLLPLSAGKDSGLTSPGGSWHLPGTSWCLPPTPLNSPACCRLVRGQRVLWTDSLIIY